MSLVAGVDSSTQSCKVVICEAATGALVREGLAPHPQGTEVDPRAWWSALEEAAARAGGLDGVAALAVAGQQHGMICLDDEGEIVRDALLWNDTRSASAALELIDELGGGDSGRQAWAGAVGSVPVASFTVTKLRWLAQHEPASATRTAAVCLPHDWLTWRLSGSAGVETLRTDRGDASGTGYWSPTSGNYRMDLLVRALGHEVELPRVLSPNAPAGWTEHGVLLGPGTGDNAASALGVGAEVGDVLVSIGTSGVVAAVSASPAADGTGVVAGFADATGAFLPLVATLNAARVLDAAAHILGVSHERLSDLALEAPPGSNGLVLVPYLEGERSPNRPDATGAMHGMTLASSTPQAFARAAVEGLLCALADGLDALVAQGADVRRVLLIGGGARSEAVRRIAPAILGTPVYVPAPGEYVAAGAARQAAWVLSGEAEAPAWLPKGGATYEADQVPWVRERYAGVSDMTAQRLDARRNGEVPAVITRGSG